MKKSVRIMLSLFMDKAERVNVIVSSGAVLYGVKSLVATINIITKNRMAWKWFATNVFASTSTFG